MLKTEENRRALKKIKNRACIFNEEIESRIRTFLGDMFTLH